VVLLGWRGTRAAVAAGIAVAAIAAVSLLVVAPAAVAAPRAAGTLTVVADETVGDPRLHELTLLSPALGRTAKVRVLLPAGYDDPAEAGRRYPVLLLLHGVGDDQTSISRRTDLVAMSAATPIIIVMPEAGRTPESGWYSDWQQGPAWESFHIGELVPFVDATYRTTADRASRAIAGLSMGGFGAMSYAARHPELFGTAAAFSGAVDTTYAGDVESIAFDVLHQQGGTPDDRVWGPYATDEARWRAHNPTDLVTNLRWTSLWLASGNGVAVPGDKASAAPFEAGIRTMNLSFDLALTRHGIAHGTYFPAHGVHDWPYWQTDLHLWWPILLDALAHPQQAPTAFDYRSAEPAFAAWGWSFGTDRPGLQFVDLTGVSPQGFTVTGSGPLTVETAPAYEPGTRCTLRADDGASTSEVADADGRLHFTVDLGPGHAAAPSVVAGVAVPGVSLDQRVTRTVTIAAGEADATPRAGDVAGTAAPAALPATGGDGPVLWWAAITLLVALAARRCRTIGILDLDAGAVRAADIVVVD
jgi:S-formylglutathione hydrolase FrmB